MLFSLVCYLRMAHPGKSESLRSKDEGEAPKVQIPILTAKHLVFAILGENWSLPHSRDRHSMNNDKTDSRHERKRQKEVISSMQSDFLQFVLRSNKKRMRSVYGQSIIRRQLRASKVSVPE